MIKHEDKAYKKFRDAAGLRLILRRIENQMGSGTPDIIGCNRQGRAFWIEGKALPEWPKRKTTCPLKGKFEKGQLSFLREWICFGVPSFVMLTVEGVPRLLNPVFALGELDRDGIEAAAVITGMEEVITFLEIV